MDAAVGSAIERLLGRLPIGWLQLRHNRTRLIAAIGGVAFASLLVLMQLGFQGALVGSIGLPYRALEAELLSVDRGLVKPTFDIHSIEVPKGYTPGPGLLQANAQPKGLFMKMVEHVSAARSIPAKDVISRANAVQDRMGVDAEVAALIVAGNMGIDVTGFLDAVEEDVGKRYKK